jgi:hypothetical protein
LIWLGASWLSSNWVVLGIDDQAKQLLDLEIEQRFRISNNRNEN